MKSQEKKDRLLERIVAHFTKRIRDGKFPSIDRYKREYPEWGDEIEEILSSIAMIEELKQLEVNDPTVSGELINQLTQEKLGDYRMIRELGRGGMGVVFEAVHESLGRRVAIKVLPESSIQNPRQLERFRREAQAAANLHHTNIVSVFGVGQHEGHHYYVMEFIDGQNLGRIIHQIRNPSDTEPSFDLAALETLNGSDRSTCDSMNSDVEPRPHEKSIDSLIGKRGENQWHWVADLGSQIADALAHAHQHGILHRDIKPSNLVLDGNNVVWITDFGLVKNSTNQTLTKTGDVVGTPQYMAPESFEGKYDARSETYCLGLTLYELTTLKPAFEEKTTHELIRSITTSRPEPPGKICPGIPSDLNTIIEKAIQRDPIDRYATASELRDDLRAFLTDQPILARRSDPLEKAWRWTRRNRLVTSLVLASVVLICLVAITATTGYITTQNALSQLSVENSKLVVAEAEIKAKEQLANSNYEQMKEQFDRAETNVSLTLEMLDQMFDQMILKDSTSETDLEIDGFDELSEIRTAVTAEDARFLERMLVFYERFTEQNSDNELLVLQTASAYRRVANIYQLIGEADKAEPAYLQAIEIYQKLLSETNQLDKIRTRELTLSIARTRNDWAVLQSNKGLRAHSENSLRITVQELEGLHTTHADVKFELAKTHFQLASTPLRTTSMGNQAENENRRSDGRRRRPAENGESDQSPLGENRRRDVPRPPPGVIMMKYENAVRALQLFKELNLSDPDKAEYELFHAKTLMQLASSELENQEKQQALLQQAKQELEQLKDRYPDNPEYQYALGVFYFKRTGQSQDESINNMEMANQIGKELYQSYPLNIRYRQLYANASFSLARQYRQIGESKKSRDNQLVALSMWTDLSSETNDIRYFYQKTSHQLALAREFIQQEKFTDAKILLQESIDELQSGKIHQLAIRYTKRFQRERPGTPPQFRGRFREQIPGIRLREDEFWVQYQKRLVDHYGLLSNVLQKLGDFEGSSGAKEKISQIQVSDLKKGVFPSGT